MAFVTLTDRVMVQILVIVADNGGGQARIWSDFREVWARIQWGGVGRDTQNGEVGLRRKATITLRWAPDLPDPMRLIAGQKTLTVLSMARSKVGSGAFLDIECEDTF